jgi:hypothetical protein
MQVIPTCNALRSFSQLKWFLYLYVGTKVSKLLVRTRRRYVSVRIESAER